MARSAARLQSSRSGGVHDHLTVRHGHPQPGLGAFVARARRPLPEGRAAIPKLDASYLSRASRERTVVICGSSKSKPGTQPFEAAAFALAKAIVEAGGNVLTGNGTKGTMGAALFGAAAGAKAPQAGENLTVIKNKDWGDEDFMHGRALAHVATEEARFDLFQRLGSTVVFFPGGVGTLLELFKCVEGVAVDRGLPPFDSIVIVGGDDFYRGTQAQLDELVAAGTLSPENRAKIHFVDAKADIINVAMPKALRKAA